MKAKKENHCPVMWTEEYLKRKKIWYIVLIAINIFYLIIMGLILDEIGIADNIKYRELLSMYKVKVEIYKLLRGTGISLNQGLDIADIIVNKCKEKDLPIALVLAVIDKESKFVVGAVSCKGAKGLMQIHPVKWDEYLPKVSLDLKIDQVMFDPVINVKIGIMILSDLYEKYKKKWNDDNIIWALALSAYYAGEQSVNNGLTEIHKKYVKDVKKLKNKYEQLLM